MSGGPSTLQQRAHKQITLPSVEENSENGKSDGEGEEDNSEDDSEDNSKNDSQNDSKEDSESNEPEDFDDPDFEVRAMCRGVKQSKSTMHNNTTTEFTDFKNIKSRQTHSSK